MPPSNSDVNFHTYCPAAWNLGSLRGGDGENMATLWVRVVPSGSPATCRIRGMAKESAGPEMGSRRVISRDVRIPILILRSTPAARAHGPGPLGRASSSGSNFTFSFLSIFYVFYICLQLFYVLFFVFNFFLTFLPEFLCGKFFSKFSISESFAELFWLLKFCLYKNFAPWLFFPKFIDHKIFQSKFYEIFLFRVFSFNYFPFIFFLKTFGA